MGLRRDGQSSPLLANNDLVVSRLARQDKVPWYRKRNLRFLYLLMLPTCIGVEMTSGYDTSMVNGLQAVPSWLEYYNHPHSASLGLMASMYALGYVAAVPFAPFVADKFGRRYPIFFASVVSVIGGILQGSALNFTMFVAARFILGFSIVFCVVAASALIGELSYPKERAFIGGFFHASYYLGSILAAAITLATFAMTSNWGWRIPSFLQVIPGLLQVSFVLFIPESPRWLISKGRCSEALDILVKYHAEGDSSSEFVRAEYAQIEQTIEAGQAITRMNGKQVFSMPGMRKRAIITTFLGLCTPWSGSALISHFLALILDNIGIHDNRTKNIVNLAKVSWKFVNGTFLVLITPRYPRRTMYLACTISLFIILSAFTVASADYSFTQRKLSAQVVLVLVFLHSPAYNLGFGSLDYNYLAEIFPFHVRASGIALYQWWNRGGGFLAQFFNPIGIDAIGWKWYITYCVWNAIQIAVVYFMFPETSGRTLEELAFLYEDDREALMHDGAGLLRGNEGTETYGTMEGHPTRSFASDSERR